MVGQGSVKPGDVLALERWVVPARAGLRVSIPKPAPAAEVERAAAGRAKVIPVSHAGGTVHNPDTILNAIVEAAR